MFSLFGFLTRTLDDSSHSRIESESNNTTIHSTLTNGTSDILTGEILTNEILPPLRAQSNNRKGTSNRKDISNNDREFSFDISALSADLLSHSDLSRSDLFVIYVYYDRNNFNCKNCMYFRSFLSHIRTPLKFINFGSDVYLGSKFNTYVFPAFIVRNKNRTYKVQNVKTGEELVVLLNTLIERPEELENRKYFYQFKRRLEIGSALNTVMCCVNVVIFRVIDVCHLVMRVIPEWMFHTMIFMVIIYLIWSIISTLRERGDKDRYRESGDKDREKGKGGNNKVKEE